MPTPVSSARLCLAGEAAAALDDAVSVARRRHHAQTTSLHVVFALLSSHSSNSSPSSSASSPLLRDALSRARSSAYSLRLQFKALELCFGVALDRLPSSSMSSSSACSASADEPPVSNSLMAAIKRSQANQRRHPDTFHFYQQQQLNSSSSSSSSFSGVKVELQQLILAILDDPVVSRVFGDAGFRSSDIKLAVLRPPPPILRFPRPARCPPLFLCNFAAGDDLESLNLTSRGFSFPLSDGCGENCRRIGEIMARKSNRNPLLVGVGAGDAARDYVRAIERQNWGFFPPDLANLKFVSLEKELIDVRELEDSANWIKGKLEELGTAAKEDARVLVGIGDLKGLVELGDDFVNCLVSEMTRALESCRDRLWMIGWSATYETYMKFLSKYPTLDKDWDLQLQLITSARSATGGLVSRAPSLMESFVPFGGFFPTIYESNIPIMKTYSPRCQLCNDKYEQELDAILKGCTPCEELGQAKLPSWLQSVDILQTNSSLDASKVKDDEEVLNARVADLQMKWNNHCMRLHQGFPKPQANTSQVLPPIIGIPYVSDNARSINPSIINVGVTQSQNGLRSTLPVTVGLQKMTAFKHGLSLPGVSKPANKDLISKLQVGVSRSEQLRTEDLWSNQSALSELSTLDGRDSPSSVTSVKTDLVLGTLHEPSCAKEVARCSPSKKATDFRHQTLSAPNASLSSANMYLKVDRSNFKAFYNSFREKVHRQDAAISAISLAIIQCKAGHERRRRASLKGDIWLSFLGPDKFGKKRAVTALADLMFGSRENMICIDLGCQDSTVSRNFICDHHETNNSDVSFRGTTYADHIAAEISKRPSSVVFLENLEKADIMVQDRLSQAIRTGKISDTHGCETGINNAIFVVTTSRDWGKNSLSRKETVNFCEDDILAAPRWQMKISVEYASKVTGGQMPINVSVTSRQESENKQVASKRKLCLSDHHIDQQQFSDSPKRAHTISNAFLDLNLPVEEVVDDDADGSYGSNSSSGDEQWVEEFLKSMDENIHFEPFDFDSLADYVAKEISKRFCDAIGSECSMEIDRRAMEQILAAAWLLEDVRDLNNWFENVLLRSFLELRRVYSNKLSARFVVKLTASEETFSEDHSPGVLLPSRIILD